MEAEAQQEVEVPYATSVSLLYMKVSSSYLQALEKLV